MSGFAQFLREVADLTCDTAPFLLIGFVLAGMLKVWLPGKAIYGHLGGNNLRSVLRASLYGIPLPLCSCSVIPTATSLKRNGASKGATASFLISTPETGVDSISVTYALLDPIMTVARPLVALVTAITTGSIVSLFVRRGWDSAGTGDLAAEEHDHAGGDGAPEGLGARLRDAFGYAFGPLLDDLTPWLIIGFAISALMSMVIPDTLFVDTVPAGWPSMLLMMVVATPVYICATASTPIAAVLIAKGLDPGAALVFLLVGPATNVTTLIVVSRLLGRNALAIYILSITGVALGAGWLIGEIYTLAGLDLAAVVSAGLSTEPGWIATISGVVFAVLLLRSALRLDLWAGWRRRVVVAGAVAVWATTSFTLLYPGERGWVLRFGGVARTLEEPGLYWHWPYPVDRPEIIAAQAVRSVALGFDPTSEAARKRRTGPERRLLDDQAEVMAGDGTLLRVTYSVHYKARDAYRVHFGLHDVERLTRAFAETAVRQVVARSPGSAWLERERLGLGERTAERLQAELDAIDSGVAIASVNVRDLHAPPDVHYEYRDVASALEEREKAFHEAQGKRAEQMAEAAKRAYREEQIAAAARDAVIRRAEGETQRFLLNFEAYQEQPAISKHRLWLETLEKALGSVRLFALLGEDIELELVDLGEEKTLSPVEQDMQQRFQGTDPARRAEIERIIRGGK